MSIFNCLCERNWLQHVDKQVIGFWWRRAEDVPLPEHRGYLVAHGTGEPDVDVWDALARFQMGARSKSRKMGGKHMEPLILDAAVLILFGFSRVVKTYIEGLHHFQHSLPPSIEPRTYL